MNTSAHIEYKPFGFIFNMGLENNIHKSKKRHLYSNRIIEYVNNNTGESLNNIPANIEPYEIWSTLVMKMVLIIVYQSPL